MKGRLAQRPLTPFLFVAPAVSVLAVFVGAAFVDVAYLSFTRFNAFADRPEWVGWANYRAAVSSPRFWACLLNSACYLLVTPVLVALSLLAAMLIRTGVRGAGGLRVLLFLPVVTPAIVGALAWQLLLKDQGVFNRALGSLGLEPISWLSRRPWTLISPMLVTLWKGFGFYMMIFLAGLLAVPRELEEAAAIDGGGRWTALCHVVLPAIWPVMVLVMIVSSISALKVFDEVFVTVKGAPIEHQTMVPLVFHTAFEARGGDHGLASAIGMLLFFLVLAMSILNLRLSRARERAGGDASLTSRPAWMSVLIYGGGALLAAVAIGPTLWLALIALQRPGRDLNSISLDFTLANFQTAWEKGRLAEPLINSILSTLIRASLNVLLASLAAYPLARMRFRGRDTIFIVILATMMIPDQVILVPMFRIVAGLGMYDTLAALVVPFAVSSLGVFMCRQAFLQIPASMDEAARIDGASSLRIWWHVMLPLAAPTLATLALFSVIGAWSDLLWPLVVLQSRDNYTLPVAINELTGVFNTNLRLAYAAAVLALVPIIAVFVAVQRWFRPQLFAGSVKG